MSRPTLNVKVRFRVILTLPFIYKIDDEIVIDDLTVFRSPNTLIDLFFPSLQDTPLGS